MLKSNKISSVIIKLKITLLRYFFYKNTLYKNASLVFGNQIKTLEQVQPQVNPRSQKKRKTKLSRHAERPTSLAVQIVLNIVL